MSTSSSVDEDKDTIQLTDDQTRSVREEFNRHSVDGAMPVEKLQIVMRGLGHRITDGQLVDLMCLVDKKGAKAIGFEEFLPLVAEKIKEKEEQAFYKNLFRMLDKKNKGFIKCEDLRYILMGIAKEVDLTEDEVDEMIADIDEDGNGEVSFEEFHTLMTSE